MAVDKNGRKETMEVLTERMRRHHRQCDDAFADAEDAAQGHDWTRCSQAFSQFQSLLEAHLTSEEQIVFPAFEARSGMVGGPAQVMRAEHMQMRALVAQMQKALSDRNADAFGGAAQTLLVMMQQHNMKEENILYPMCDRILAGDEPLLIALEHSLSVG